VSEPEKIYGLLAEFETEHELLAAARRVRAEGYRRADAFSPFPIKGLFQALGHRNTPIPLIVLSTGAFFCLGGFFMQWFASVVDYPLNIGGRPLNSWPAFIPITFELTVLGAALAAVGGMLMLNRLPCPYHPVFNAPHFDRASLDRFFICIESSDPKFDSQKTREFLAELKPLSIAEVTP
jgi:hypothetical protein